MIARWLTRRLLPLTTTVLAGVLSADIAVAQVSPSICGSLSNGFGPYDYRTERGNPLNLVESAHFTPKVEALVSGNSSSTAIGDIDYTLRAFPNHHRALISITRLTERAKSPQPPGFTRPAECYFERAVRWRPDDTVARMLYAQYLYLWKRPDEAKAQLERAAHDARDNPMTHYNIGLVYFEGGDLDHALLQAHKAYALGFTRPELRERLKQSGRWREPEPAANTLAGAASAPVDAASAAQSPASAAGR